MNQQEADKITTFIEQNTPSMTDIAEYREVRDFILSLVREDDRYTEGFEDAWDILLNKEHKQIAKRMIEEYFTEKIATSRHSKTFWKRQRKLAINWLERED